MTLVTMAPTISRRERHKAEVRRRIIESAISLFSEQGITSVTVEQIAAAADVGKGTVYNYFRTKEEIVVAFMEEFEQSVQAHLGRFETKRRSLAPILIDFISLQLKLKEPQFRFVRVFYAQMFTETEAFLPHMAAIHQIVTPTLHAFLSGLQTRGLIRPDILTVDVVSVFTNLQFGLTAMWAIEGPPFAATSKLIDAQIKLFCSGIESRTK